MQDYDFNYHLSRSVLLRNLTSTHTGSWMYKTWPYAICSTPSWSRLVVLPFYFEKRYPKEYYTEATITEI